MGRSKLFSAILIETKLGIGPSCHCWEKMEVYPMRYLLHFLILVAMMAFSPLANAENNFEVFEPLTSDEMAFPPGRYQVGINIGHTCRVDMDSPEVEPVLLWTESMKRGEIILDSEGGIWLPKCDPDSYLSDSIKHLRPDGTMDWEKMLIPKSEWGFEFSDDSSESEDWWRNSIVSPVISLQGAVICLATRDEHYSQFSSDLQETRSKVWGYSFLECIDLSGNTIWRTQLVRGNIINGQAWRVDNDRIAMISSETSFNVYSISDGELLETITVPGWSACCYTGPYPTEDGGWIIQGDIWDPNSISGGYPYIYRLNLDGSNAWKAEYQTWSFALPVTISDDGIILFGNRNGIRAIDINGGSELWCLEGGMYHACGITPDENYVMIGSFEDKSILGTLDSAGNQSWSYQIDWPYGGVDDVIIYRDGCILIGDRNRITLLYPDGSVKWMIDYLDMGVEEDTRTGMWKLNPTPEGGIVGLAYFSGGEVLSSNRLFYFGPGL
ncbi:MAG: hypothetical protein NTY09_12385 [bacterium]|nr:hypothetical protein [bacterium]